MKVALFHTTLPEAGRKPGGVETVVHRLGNALVECGVEVTVYSLTGAPPGAQYQHKRLFPNAAWLKDSHAGRLLALPVLLNFVRFDPADVLHLHGDDWFLLRRGVPKIRTLHGSALLEARAAQSWKRRLEQYAIYPLEQLSARLAHTALAIGSTTARLYRTRYQIDNGIDTGFFHPGLKTAHPQIFYLGTWKGRKRGEFLYRAFIDEVLPAFPDAQLCFAAEFCPEHPNVRFLQFPSDQELARYHRESWVFAYPSVYEGFGVAYLEALASGTAILSSPNEGATHVLDNGKYGIIADDGDFAAQLIELLASAARREELARAGLERAAQFSWTAIAQRHLEIYKEAISAPERN